MPCGDKIVTTRLAGLGIIFGKQGTFDHDKGQKSAISGTVSTSFFQFSPVFFFPFSPGFFFSV